MANHSAPANKLLACLSPAELGRLQPHLRPVTVKRKQVFYKTDEPIREVYFLHSGVASMTTVMRDGSMVEIATVGREGLVGMDAYFGEDVTTGETMMQVDDATGDALPVNIFKQELDRRGTLYGCVQRYGQGLIALMKQSTACMALHPAQERCCRWLLMTHDRVGRDDFRLSHEFLSVMLGTTRPTVTLVAGTLQQAGLIDYKHGHIWIRDRARLEEASCECYETVREHFDRLGL